MIIRYILDEWSSFTFERELTKEAVVRYLYRKSIHLDLEVGERAFLMYGVALGSPFVQSWIDKNEGISVECIENYLKQIESEE